MRRNPEGSRLEKEDLRNPLSSGGQGLRPEQMHRGGGTPPPSQEDIRRLASRSEAFGTPGWEGSASEGPQSARERGAPGDLAEASPSRERELLRTPTDAFVTPRTPNSFPSYTASEETEAPPHADERVREWINESSRRGASGFRNSLVDVGAQVEALEDQIKVLAGSDELVRRLEARYYPSSGASEVDYPRTLQGTMVRLLEEREKNKRRKVIINYAKDVDDASNHLLNVETDSNSNSNYFESYEENKRERDKIRSEYTQEREKMISEYTRKTDKAIIEWMKYYQGKQEWHEMISKMEKEYPKFNPSHDVAERYEELCEYNRRLCLQRGIALRQDTSHPGTQPLPPNDSTAPNGQERTGGTSRQALGQPHEASLTHTGGMDPASRQSSLDTVSTRISQLSLLKDPQDSGQGRRDVPTAPDHEQRRRAEATGDEPPPHEKRHRRRDPGPQPLSPDDSTVPNRQERTGRSSSRRPKQEPSGDPAVPSHEQRRQRVREQERLGGSIERGPDTAHQALSTNYDFYRVQSIGLPPMPSTTGHDPYNVHSSVLEGYRHPQPYQVPLSDGQTLMDQQNTRATELLSHERRRRAEVTGDEPRPREERHRRRDTPYYLPYQPLPSTSSFDPVLSSGEEPGPSTAIPRARVDDLGDEPARSRSTLAGEDAKKLSDLKRKIAISEPGGLEEILRSISPDFLAAHRDVIDDRIRQNEFNDLMGLLEEVSEDQARRVVQAWIQSHPDEGAREDFQRRFGAIIDTHLGQGSN